MIDQRFERSFDRFDFDRAITTIMPSEFGAVYGVAPTCRTCGALVMDQEVHEGWHRDEGREP